MLSAMHLGSVLVGIVIGLVLGVLVARLAGRGRRSEGQEHWPPPRADPSSPSPETGAPGLQETQAIQPIAQDPRPSEGGPELAGIGWDVGAAGTDQEHPKPLLDELLAANRRLTDEAHTRLSRESPEASPAANPLPRSSPGQQGSGQDLLERSRRLREDAERRLARGPDAEAG